MKAQLSWTKSALSSQTVKVGNWTSSIGVAIESREVIVGLELQSDMAVFMIFAAKKNPMKMTIIYIYDEEIYSNFSYMFYINYPK